MTKRKFGQTMANNFYLLKEIHKAAPSYIILSLLDNLSGTLLDYMVEVLLLGAVVRALEGHASFAQVAMLIVIIALYPVFCRIFISYIRMVAAPAAQSKIQQHLQGQIFQKIKGLSLSSQEDPQFYDSCLKATEEAGGGADAVLGTISCVACGIFTLLLVSFTVLFLDPILVAAALIPPAVNLLLGKPINRLRLGYRTEMQICSRRRDYAKRVFFLSDYAKDLRMTGIANLLFKQFDSAIREMKGTVRKYGWKLAAFDYLLALVQSLVSYLGIILYVAYRTLVTGSMSYGTCIIAINAVTQAAGALQMLAACGVDFQSNGLFAENLLGFLQDDSHQDAIGGEEEMPEKCTLRFENVAFRYPGKSKPSIRKLSLTLHPGEKIALVGPNGAGKSTLIKLLLRLYEPDEGQITLNGQPVAEYPVKAYR